MSGLILAIGIFNTNSENRSSLTCVKKLPTPAISMFTHEIDRVNKHLDQFIKEDTSTSSLYFFSDDRHHHYYLKWISDTQLAVICTKTPLNEKEAAYLLINIKNALLYQQASGVTLEDIYMNPLGYTNRDHLPDHVRQSIQEVKEIMLKNIDSMLQRGEAIDQLVTQTDNLAYVSGLYRERSRTLNNSCWNGYGACTI